METPAVPRLLAAIVLCVLGGGERIVSATHQRDEARWLAAASKADGTVVRTIDREAPSTLTSGDPMRFDVVAYRAADGSVHAFEAAAASAIGSHVTVAYDAGDPSNARVVTHSAKRASFGPGYILIAAGIAVGVTAFVPIPGRDRSSATDERIQSPRPRSRERSRG